MSECPNPVEVSTWGQPAGESHYICGCDPRHNDGLAHEPWTEKKVYAQDPRLCRCGKTLLPVHDCDDEPPTVAETRDKLREYARKKKAGTRQSTYPPRHYKTESGLQPWDVVDAFGLDYYRGSALKYLLRAGRKGPALEDLQKAQDFLAKAIEKARDE